MPLRPYRNLFSVILFVVGAAALAPLRAPAPAVAAGGHRPLPAAVREALGERLRPHDQPAEALEFYRLKRAPAGQSQVPVERYFQALQAMRFMPQHSIARGAVLPSRAEGGLEAIGEESNLGGWTALGPGNIGGRTRALVVDPRQPSTLYAAGVAGGVWKSTDTGVSWRPLADLLANIAINSLAMDPANSSVLYAGTGEGYFNIDAVRGAGIFKTTDGGATWTRLAATTGFGYVNDIVISSRDGRRVYAATDTGVWRSLDGGATWSQVLATTVFGGCLDLAIRTDQRTDWVFAACGTFEQATVYRSTAAESAGPWLRVLTERAMGRTTLAIAPSNQDVIYAVAAVNANDDSDQGLLAIFRSTTGGGPKSWTAQVRNTDPRPLNTLLLSNPVIATLKECGFGDTDFLFNQGWYDETIAVDPRDPNRVWLGGIDLFRSDDGGRTWGLASYWWGQDPSGDAPSYAHADQHVLVFDPRYDGAANRTLYVGNDGGVFRTLNARAATARGNEATCDPANSAVVWQNLNHGYAVTQFYGGAVYPDGTTYFGGAQDNGTSRGTDAAGPNAWEQILGGDGGYTAVDPHAPSTLYAENTGLSLAKTPDGGAHWLDATHGIAANEDFLFITPFTMDPSNPDRLWLGGSSLWRTTDGAAHWQQASPAVPGTRHQTVSAVDVSPVDGNRVMAGTSEGFILHNEAALTATATTHWWRNRPQQGYVSSVTYDAVDPIAAYATYSTFGVVHVWKTVNGGFNWSPLDGAGTGKLPDLPVHKLVVDPAHPTHLYVGTDLGVFSSFDGGQHWLIENTGFANAPTDWLVIHVAADGTRTLYAFTHGRGVWRVRLPD